MYGSQIFKFQRARSTAPRQLPPVPTGTFAMLPLALWARLWSRHSTRRVVTGLGALRLIRTFANDA